MSSAPLPISESDLHPSIGTSSQGRSAVKLLKLRKGTHSCWECKRRKIRCKFQSKSSAICDACHRHARKCVGQEVPESVHTANSSYYEVEKRIVHVEGLFDQLVQQTAVPGCQNSRDIAQDIRPRYFGTYSATNSNLAEPLLAADTSTPVPVLPVSSSCGSVEWAPASDVQSFLPFVELETDHSSLHNHEIGRQASLVPSLVSEMLISLGPANSLSHYLHSILPPQNVATLILCRGNIFSLPIQMVKRPYRALLESSGAEEFSQLYQLPPPTAHPILQARVLIQLAICLQQLGQNFNASELFLSESACDVARLYADAASHLVTSQDSLVSSLDGLQILMLEGLYQLNLGNLRRGWLIFRRALGVAQLIGLPYWRQRKAEVMEDITLTLSEFLWFRLVYSDRSLSLTLGLPAAVVDDSFTSEDTLVSELPVERLERIHTRVMGRISRRNELMSRSYCGGEDVYDDYMETQDIDYELQLVANSLPANWWLLPDMTSNVDEMETASRLFAQTHQYHLLILLHLPYVVHESRPCGSHTIVGPVAPLTDHTYSKVTAVTASRDLLSRFLAFRTFNIAPYCCAAVDFKAFTASLALLLAHIDGHRLGRANMFAHQRPHDLGMIGRAVENMEQLPPLEEDDMNKSTTQVLRELMEIEADAAGAASYYIYRGESIRARKSRIGEEDDVIKLLVPYFGTIGILRAEI